MKKCLLFCVIVFAAFCGKTVAQNVTNLDFALREGKVVITYALDYPADIKAYYSLDDGNSYKEITKATGDLGALVTPSPMKRIDWDAFAEVENLEYESDVALVIKVEAIANAYTKQAMEAAKKMVTEEKADQYLIVRCADDGAMLYLDSTGTGLPFDKGVLRVPITAGNHTYKIEAPMYETESGSVEVLAYQNKEITVALMPLFAVVTAVADPEYLIYVDDEYVAKGQWEGRLLQGQHTLEARKSENHLSIPYMYKAVKGTTQTINLKNATPAALLMVESKEEGANIYIDGENKGSSKTATVTTIGEHDIKLKKHGFENTDTTVILEHGKTANVSLRMLPVTNKFFFLGNIAYSMSPQTSYGITLGTVKYWGWYLSATTNLDFSSMGYEFVEPTEGYYTGKTSTSRFAATVGIVRRLNKIFYLKAGVGYGIRNLSWQKSDGDWVNIAPNSFSGLEASAGMQMMFGSFVISAEAVVPTTKIGKYCEARIGVGFAF